MNFFTFLLLLKQDDWDLLRCVGSFNLPRQHFLRYFLDNTKQIRKQEENGRLTLIKKPYKAASSATISRCTKQVLTEAGICTDVLMSSKFTHSEQHRLLQLYMAVFMAYILADGNRVGPLLLLQNERTDKIH